MDPGWKTPVHKYKPRAVFMRQGSQSSKKWVTETNKRAVALSKQILQFDVQSTTTKRHGNCDDLSSDKIYKKQG